MKTELLERLSKAAPEFIQVHGHRLVINGKISPPLEEIDKWQLFGAICEKANAKGWTLAVKFNADGSCVVDSIVKDGWEFRAKLAWEAAALALCEALEGKQQEVTG